MLQLPHLPNYKFPDDKLICSRGPVNILKTSLRSTSIIVKHWYGEEYLVLQSVSEVIYCEYELALQGTLNKNVFFVYSKCYFVYSK